MSSPDPEWVTVAVLGKARGNHGEVIAVALSSRPERYQALHSVYLFGGSQPAGRCIEVESTWFHGNTLIFKFRGIDTISDAETLAGAEVRLPVSERMPLETDEFFQSDLVGCEVIDRQTGESLGRVSGWDDAGSGLLEVGGRLIPFARSICVEINIAARQIVVDLPDGLKDLNAP
ncbi:MAG TPA: ribosome maturation factor RimM [Bryobacteraceae bacterium]|nr:ribosome maturation factor RimM [Bryobacteraceae bacterium]